MRHINSNLQTANLLLGVAKCLKDMAMTYPMVGSGMHQRTFQSGRPEILAMGIFCLQREKILS